MNTYSLSHCPCTVSAESACCEIINPKHETLKLAAKPLQEVRKIAGLKRASTQSNNQNARVKDLVFRVVVHHFLMHGEHHHVLAVLFSRVKSAHKAKFFLGDDQI